MANWVMANWVTANWVTANWVMANWVMANWVMANWVTANWVMANWVTADPVTADWRKGNSAKTRSATGFRILMPANRAAVPRVRTRTRHVTSHRAGRLSWIPYARSVNRRRR
jgi:hypothetical protein